MKISYLFKGIIIPLLLPVLFHCEKNPAKPPEVIIALDEDCEKGFINCDYVRDWYVCDETYHSPYHSFSAAPKEVYRGYWYGNSFMEFEIEIPWDAEVEISFWTIYKNAYNNSQIFTVKFEKFEKQFMGELSTWEKIVLKTTYKYPYYNYTTLRFSYYSDDTNDRYSYWYIDDIQVKLTRIK